MTSEQRSGLAGHPVLDADILSGLNLLEADAGTGKTWTVVRLVLRAIVERNIAITNIAVLTFTNAAAAELRDRIGQSLDDWLNEASSTLTDPFRAHWHHDVAPELVRARLRLARLQLDDAPIGTIHGFCQRILSDNALSLGRWDKPEPGPSDDAVLREAVAAWWRQNIIGGPPALAGLCGRDGLSMGRLQAILEAALRDPRAEIVNGIGDLQAGLTGDMVSLPDRLRSAVDDLRQAWSAEEEPFREWLSGPAFTLSKTKYNPDKVSGLAGGLMPFLDAYPASLPGGCEMLLYLDPNRIDYAMKKGSDPRTVDMFRSFRLASTLLNCLRERSNLPSIVASQIRGDVQARMRVIQQHAGTIAFDDLLEQTRSALFDPVVGERLANQLRSRYRITFVDEFQDTDPAQWDIFSRIYRPPGVDLENGAVSDTALILVGDPKQAIYSFRNADIQTYLSAARLDGKRHRLNQNHRANHLLIDAVNALHDRPGAFAAPDIGFVASDYGSRSHEPASQPPDDGLGALSFVLLDDDSQDEKGSVPQLRALAATACAAEIGRLLKSSDINANEIAVLVPARAGGKQVYKALADIGIGAVEISRDSVFSSSEAADLFRIIAAVANPSRSDLVRGALTTQLIGFDLAKLTRAAEDRIQWQALLLALARARQRWMQAGPQAALRELLFADLNRAAPLAGAMRGERRLTNLLHLLSLLSDEPAVVRSAAQGQAWLGRQIRYALDEGDSEQSQVRLESDENLVSILTIHASKGLQFPFVFLPFAWTGSGVRGGTSPVHRVHDPVNGKRVIADGRKPHWYWDKDPAARPYQQLASFARFQESVRLNYVALTRAERRCYVFWGTTNKPGDCPVALAWLLDHKLSSPADPCDYGKKFKAKSSAVNERLQGLATNIDGISLEPWRELVARLPALNDDGPGETRLTDSSSLTVNEPSRFVQPAWITRSFSSLAQSAGSSHDGHLVRPDHDQEQAQGLLEDRGPDASESLSQAVPFTFPRGANPGSCLHDILEGSDFTDPVDSSRVGRILRRYAISADPTAVAGWMNQVLSSSLPGAVQDAPGRAFRLSNIAWADSIRELSYTLAVSSLRPTELSHCIGEHYPVPLLDPDQWTGFLNGFIDLLVRVDGRYWLIDWKSNWLGAQPSDYLPAVLDAPMAEHAYMLQMSLYTLAVHRMLRARLPGYRYSTHFGGVRYLFLRGMSGDDSGNGVFCARLPESLVDEMDKLLGGASRG